MAFNDCAKTVSLVLLRSFLSFEIFPDRFSIHNNSIKRMISVIIITIIIIIIIIITTIIIIIIIIIITFLSKNIN